LWFVGAYPNQVPPPSFSDVYLRLYQMPWAYGDNMATTEVTRKGQCDGAGGTKNVHKTVQANVQATKPGKRT